MMIKILVMEDELSIRENIVELLEDEGYVVFEAADGREGLDLALDKMPDLIISDIMMPVLDGYGVLKAVREHPPLATTPFIFLSAKADKPDLRIGMELGADDYLTKPFTQEELLQAIASRLSRQNLIKEEAEKKVDDLRKNISYALPHELRTPLSGIIGPAKMMLDTFDLLEKEDIRQFLMIIHESGERLHRLIQNFLLYAQLEMDSNDMAQIASMRRGATKSADPIISKGAAERAIYHKRTEDLKINLVDAPVAIAHEHLEKICSELVDNGFKFSKSGDPVEVTGTTSSTMYNMSIRDRGKGMTDEDIEKIGGFVQFKRRLHEQQGPGLGLTIAKRLIELHGGALKIVSTPGTGTTVTAMLPLLKHL
jgi:two-component system, sensor histidine kinase and response regulator